MIQSKKERWNNGEEKRLVEEMMQQELELKKYYKAGIERQQLSEEEAKTKAFVRLMTQGRTRDATRIATEDKS